MPGWRLHRYWAERLAERLGLDPALAGEVDRLIDDPGSYIGHEIPDDAFECLKERGVDPGVLAALRFGIIEHDWYTQRLSGSKVHTSREWLRILRAVADCLIAPGAGLLAELHVALDMISKYRVMPRGEVLGDLKERGVSREVLGFVEENFDEILQSLERRGGRRPRKPRRGTA